MIRIFTLLFFALAAALPAHSQGRLAIGFDVANRMEIRNYNDPQGACTTAIPHCLH